MSEIHQYEIHWKGWNTGARLPSYGYTKEYGQTPEEAQRRLCERYPRISEILEIHRVKEERHGPQPCVQRGGGRRE